MKLKFKNTPYYLQPADANISPIPDNFEVIIKLPPQKKNDLELNDNNKTIEST